MSKVWHIRHQNPHFQGQGMQQWHQNALGWMHYKIGIGSMPKTALPNLENQHFHECQLILWQILLYKTTNTHFLGTLRWVIVLTGFFWAPFHPRKTLYHVYQKVLQNLIKQFVHECKSVYWPFVLGSNRETFLSPMQWQVVMQCRLTSPEHLFTHEN